MKQQTWILFGDDNIKQKDCTKNGQKWLKFNGNDARCFSLRRPSAPSACKRHNPQIVRLSPNLPYLISPLANRNGYDSANWSSSIYQTINSSTSLRTNGDLNSTYVAASAFFGQLGS